MSNQIPALKMLANFQAPIINRYDDLFYVKNHLPH